MNAKDKTNPYASPGSIDWDAGVDIVNAVAVDSHGSLTIDYEVTVEDLVNLSIHRHHTNPALRHAFQRSWLFISGAAFFAGAIWAILKSDDPRQIAGLTVCAAIVGILLGVWYPFAHRRSIRRLVRRMYTGRNRDGIVGPHRLVVTRAAITDLTEVSKSSWRWSGVESINTSNEAVYIALMSLALVSIPRRSFGSGDEFDEFVNSIRQFHAEAGQS